MKCAILAAILLCSVAMVLCDTDVIYEPAEYGQYEEVSAVRSKRSPSPHGIDPASLAFLSGVAAGGIFGPLLYNRLYGNQGWSAPVTYTQGWQPPSKGW